MNSPVAFHVIGTTHNSFDARVLKNGERVVASVLRKADDGTYVLRIKGVAYRVRSEVQIKVGAELRLRVFRTGNTFRLVQERVIDHVSARVSRFNASGIAGREIDLITGAIIRSGMPVLPETQKLIADILAKYKRSDSFLARLVTLVLDKGIKPTESFIEELLSAFGDTGKDHDRDRGRDTGGDTGRDASNDATDDSGTDARPNANQDADADQAPKVTLEGSHRIDTPFRGPEQNEDFDDAEFSASIKSQVESGGRDDGALQLFNHRTAAHDMWQIVPYHVQKDSWFASGTIRIRSDSDGGLNGFVLEVVENDSTTIFRVENKGNRLVAHLPKRGNDRGGARRDLIEKLRNMGIESDDSKYDETFDGFSDEGSPINGGFDAFV